MHRQMVKSNKIKYLPIIERTTIVIIPCVQNQFKNFNSIFVSSDDRAAACVLASQIQNMLLADHYFQKRW